jgi:hypothetical protein
MRSGVAFSHLTAATLYGLPLPLYLQSRGELHVTVKAGRRPPEGQSVVGHELDGAVWKARDLVYRDPHRGELFALPTMMAAIVWAQLSAKLDIDDLVAVGDAIVGAKPALATLDDLREVTRLWAGRRGARAMSAALDQVRAGPLSRPESLQRLQLVRAGIPEPALNVRVTDPAGKLIAMPDLSWPKYRASDFAWQVLERHYPRRGLRRR